MKYFLGIDIGGTKCTAVLARADGGSLAFCGRAQFATSSWRETVGKFFKEIDALLDGAMIAPADIAAAGISCGGPLDIARGAIMSPPNLIGWDNVEITKMFSQKYGAPAFLQNDANACALAEWKFGAGRGTRNMVFMTFGTGLGAGLIINGRLFGGANGNAGEVGHIRLEKFGAVGYGKRGSFEGFCSGSGLAQAARTRALEILQSGRKCGFCASAADLQAITAKSVAEAAESGDADAKAVYAECGEYLGRGVSVLIDILNPERIVIGSIFERAQNLLVPAMKEAIVREALPAAAAVCEVAPAALGDAIGDYAAVSLAVEGSLGNL